MCVVLVLFFFMDKCLNSGGGDAKRLENVRKSLVLQHLDATIDGLTVLRSYNKENYFTNK